MDDHSLDLDSNRDGVALAQGTGPVFQGITIGSLPDDVLLEIVYQVYMSEDTNYSLNNRYKLAHVCQSWRSVIFSSPRRLNLTLVCTPKVPVRKLLDIWPPFPLEVYFYESPMFETQSSAEIKFDNIIAALERHDRVQKISIDSSQLSKCQQKQITTVMEKPFPALKLLSLSSVSTLPETFLNGPAPPCLRHLDFNRVSFSSLPRILLTAKHLITLVLQDIPSAGYISPEETATILSALPVLKSLDIIFLKSTPHPKRRSRPTPPPTRFVLPALTELLFDGASEYLEVLAARIDAPLLNGFHIAFRKLVSDIPQTMRFFDHLETFRPSSLILDFHGTFTAINFRTVTNFFDDEPQNWHWEIDCESLDLLDLQGVFASTAQICSQMLHFRSSVESLWIDTQVPFDAVSEIQQDEIDRTIWLQLFRSFPSVRSLKVHSVLERFIAASLQGLSRESAAEVLPSLHNLRIWKSSDNLPEQGIQSFIAARQHSNHPVTFSR